MAPNSPGSKTRTVHRFSGSAAERVSDVLASEEPLEIALLHGGRRRVAAVTMRTPGRDLDLALGFLFTEGLLPTGHFAAGGAQEPGNTVELPWPVGLPLNLRPLDRHSYTSSSCGVCGKTSIDQVYQSLPFPDDAQSWSIGVQLLYTLPDRLRDAQRLFDQTGGIHAAGLFDLSGKLLHLAEDVGRHNALDKLIGHCYQLDRLPLHRSVLVLSGRASFELLQKAAMAGISCVLSVGAPSTLAVELAEDQGITLCGFVTPRSLNCYTHPERVSSNPPAAGSAPTQP
ncbi:formate dehydrogenase accessory sulfurtransferase FdhD [Neolewinella litorea]|uniref:Sulfur carrier protein FdhD n=1 Tax=Neolewinella litorea TaxID=2562452 RepID=A0A4S4NPN3_9BACT|nr:formate dehydrogenase accessory sulfurtransferase FdhD [Neolewinella litorea]THH41025.1 formate dehydrogenase accessory sulfurtransferase FdhD [Neolewinella litorea]